MAMPYELVIIGGGPAGTAAGVYAARKKIKTALIAESIGGQSIVSDEIENWIGDVKVSGLDLAKRFETHLRAQEDIELMLGERASVIEDSGEHFIVKTESGKTIETRYLLISSGGKRKRLDIPGEKEFEGRGVAFCATCDAPLFRGKDVAVVGGGNSALEAVVDLLPYANHVYLLVRGDKTKGDPITLEKIASNERATILYSSVPRKIKGDKLVSGLEYTDVASGEEKELTVGGVFVEIGAMPNTDFIKGLVTLNERGETVVDHKTQRSSHPRIWVAGDAADVLYKQNNISAGDAVKAALNIYEIIQKDQKN